MALKTETVLWEKAQVEWVIVLFDDKRYTFDMYTNKEIKQFLLIYMNYFHKYTILFSIGWISLKSKI